MQRMITNITTHPRPFGAKRRESLIDQERRATEEFTQLINAMIEGGWIPMGPMVLMERLMVQQFYAFIEVDDESDEEE